MGCTLHIAHHGILGQKWGKRNGPPYPLDAKSHSTSEKKAGWRKSLDKPKNEGHTKSKPTNDSEDKKLHLTENQKKAIKIGATVAATALVTYGAYKLGKSGKLDTLINHGKNFVDDRYGEGLESIFKKTTRVHDITKDYLDINPNETRIMSDVNHILLARDGQPLSRVNCQACTFAYEMKCRGRDVEAQLVDTRQFSNEYLMNKLYKNPSIKDCTINTWNDLDNTLIKQGNGARGNLLLRLPNGGHSIAYEIANNRLILMDTQIGKAFGSSVLGNVYSASKDAIQYIRTDQLELNDAEFISKLIVDKLA